jgi:hypothetical protein
MRGQLTRGGPGGGQLTCRSDLEGVRRRVNALIDARATRAAGRRERDLLETMALWSSILSPAVDLRLVV